MADMPEHCPECGQPYYPEPGFYFGALFTSYALSVGLFILHVVFMLFVFIVDIAGQQFKVEAGNELFVRRLEGNEGDKISFDKILLTEDKGKVSVGNPTVKGKVNATILTHLKDDKVTVFKKHKRKGYRVLN